MIAAVESPLRAAVAVIEQPPLLLQIYDMVRRRRQVLGAGLLVGLLLGGIYYLQARRIYESEVQILVMTKDANLPTKGVEGGRDFEGRSMYEDLLATHMQLLESRRIIKHALDKRHLDELETIKEQIAKDKDPTEYIIKQLEVTRGGAGQARGAHVLRASYQGPSATDCATILNAIVESYQDFLGETFRDTSSEAVKLIAQAKAEQGRDLEQAEEAYRKFREQAPLLWKGKESSNIHQERLEKIETDLSNSRIKRTQAQARLEVIEQALAGDGADKFSDVEWLALLSDKDSERLSLLLDATKGDTASEAFLSTQPALNETARTEHDKLLTLLLKERTLLEDYGGDHPQVQKTRQQIDLMKEFLIKNSPPRDLTSHKRLRPADLVKVHAGLLKNDIYELDKRILDLQRLSALEQKDAKLLVSHELRGEGMRADVERKKELYDAVLERLREINLIKDYGGYLTEVISPVEVAKKAVKPKFLLTMALGLLVGLFGGTGMAYVVDLADRTFHSAEDLRQTLHLPIVAHVPPLEPALAKGHNGSAATSSPMAATLVAYHRPKSREAEAFRALRTALYFNTHARRQKVIQVTSPKPGDGKTTVATNLAISIAQSGKKVILVDCDMRQPKVHERFNISADAGLSDIIGGDAQLDACLHTDLIPNLAVLPCGTIPPNPAELLTSHNFEELLQVLRERYDFVLLDSPPLLAVTDPSVVAPRVDGVLLTMRISKNGRPQAIRATEILASLGVEVLGVVVNGLDQDPHYGYGEYGDRQYGYGYGYGNGEGRKDGHYYAEEPAQS